MKKGFELIWHTVAGIVAVIIAISSLMWMTLYVPWLSHRIHNYFESIDG